MEESQATQQALPPKVERRHSWCKLTSQDFRWATPTHICYGIYYFPYPYAYAGDTGDDYDEEVISLTTGVKVDGGEVGMVMERKEKKGLGSTYHLIGLTEDLAEDKQE